MAFSALIPAAASAATSLLGHVTSRGGGRPPEMQQVSTKPLDKRMQQIRDGGTAQFDSMLNAAASGTGFQAMANDRMGAAQGMPGAFTARNQQMASEARGQAFQGFVSGRQGRDQMLNQLTGQKMQIQSGNVDRANQGAMNQWSYDQQQAQRSQGLWDNIGGAIAQGAGDWYAHGQHQDQQAFNKRKMGLLEQHLSNYSANNNTDEADE